MLRIRSKVSERVIIGGALEDPNASDVEVTSGVRRVHNVPDFHGMMQGRDTVSFTTRYSRKHGRLG